MAAVSSIIILLIMMYAIYTHIKEKEQDKDLKIYLAYGDKLVCGVKGKLAYKSELFKGFRVIPYYTHLDVMFIESEATLFSVTKEFFRSGTRRQGNYVMLCVSKSEVNGDDLEGFYLINND